MGRDTPRRYYYVVPERRSAKGERGILIATIIYSRLTARLSDQFARCSDTRITVERYIYICIWDRNSMTIPHDAPEMASSSRESVAPLASHNDGGHATGLIHYSSSEIVLLVNIYNFALPRNRETVYRELILRARYTRRSDTTDRDRYDHY